MGQHCSCLFTSVRGNSYVGQDVNKNLQYDPTSQAPLIISNQLLSKVAPNGKAESFIDVSIVNDPIISQYLPKGKCEKSKSEDIEHEVTANVITIQKFSRGRVLRNKYTTTLKSSLEKSSKLLYDEWMTLTANSKVKKAEEDSHYPSYDPNGWKAYYTQNDIQPVYKEKLFNNTNLFIYEKGRIVNNDDNDMATAVSFYQGQVNIHYIKHGYGTLFHRDGGKCIGFWYDNALTGWCRYIDKNGTIFQGAYSNGVLNGKGERISIDDQTYKGDFLQGFRHGEGKEETKEMTFIGSFRKDKRCGHGELHFKNGDIYIGNLENNAFNGTGYYRWQKNGHQYTGQYYNNVMHGVGEYKWNEEEFYKGEYVKGVKEGNGEFKWKDGRRYVGPFKNGVPHGIGVFENNGTVEEVQFVRGKLNKLYKPYGRVSKDTPQKIEKKMPVNK